MRLCGNHGLGGEELMRKATSAVWAAALILALLGGVAPEASAQSSRPTVAVLDLEFGSVQQWWSGNWDIGKGVADLIVDELVNDGSYRVIERKRLDAILAEQNFSNSDRADPNAATVAKVGKALGVRYLIVGSITKFGTESKDFKVGGGGWGGGKLGVGKVGTSKGKATVALTMRMIDTSTGEIMASAKGEGTSDRSGLLLGGGGGGRGGALGGIEMGSSDFRETVLGEATEKAVQEVSLKLTAAKSRLGSE
jgi:curli biogenesis system outer membrane secretion channel CsgG